ncbi:hypothetical protein BH10PSE17_BH10PSE17_02500 [soil metagenome]
MQQTRRGRLAASLVSLVAWTGLALLLAARIDRLDGQVLPALWSNARFFTDLSNLLIAGVFGLLALAPRRVPAVLYGTPLVSTIMATGVYYGLLGGLQALGTDGVGDVIAHAVVPALVVLHWLLFTEPGKFRRGDLLMWVGFPVLYCAYALVRGALTSQFPYFFLNFNRLGAVAVLLYVLAIAIAVVVIGLAVIQVDRRLRRSSARSLAIER